MEMNEKKDKTVWKFDELEQMKEKMKQIFLPLTEESNVVCVFSVLRSFFDSLAHEISSHLRPLWRYCFIFCIIFASLVNRIIFGDNY